MDLNPKFRILIVDDEEILRKVLSRQIVKMGYEFDVASSGQEAVKKIDPGKFDAALLDYRMPEMNGLDTLKRILKIDPKMAVLMLTAEQDLEIAVNILKLGAYDYLTKPVSMDELKFALERSLELRQLRLDRENEEQRLRERVKEQKRQLESSYLDTVMALAAALEAKDRYTQGHSERVTFYSVALAREIGLSNQEIDRLSLGGQLHDIGKIGIRETVLNKNGKLTDKEYEHVKTHPLIGAQILGRIKSMAPILPIVRHHHERYDGAGYPDGLKGENVPLEARIVAVADAFDAMTSNRAYRSAIPLEEAIKRLVACKGTQFDPALVDVFQDLLSKGMISISSGDQEDPDSRETENQPVLPKALVRAS
ncbi:MAG: response regulator [Deltaproteobacteria bacterium]|nr:response regulator [Deltaproteobacteria bacterium]